MIKYRIGLGYDIHRLVRGRKLILGGVDIPFSKGLKAHSDGDVLIHAICDGMLGAAGLGDIGLHFPASDKRYAGISSLKILRASYSKISRAGFKIGNIDSVLIMDYPRVSPFYKKIILRLSEVLKIPQAHVNVKSTTNEGVSRIGKEAIAAYAIVLLKKVEGL